MVKRRVCHSCAFNKPLGNRCWGCMRSTDWSLWCPVNVAWIGEEEVL